MATGRSIGRSIAGLALAALTFAPAAVAAAAGPPLIEAVKAGDQRAVRTLVKQPEALRVHEPDGTTALHYAVHAGDGALVDLLLGAGVEANAANRYGVTPLFLAATSGNAVIVARLLDGGADAKATLPAGETVLMRAARSGSVEAIRRLAARGVDVNARENTLGETALIWAADQNHPDAVKALIALGADPNGRSRLTAFPKLVPPSNGLQAVNLPRGGWTPLMYAARDGAIDAVRALAESGANLDLTDPDGATALVTAILNAHFDLAIALVECGANPNIADATGMSPLYAAVEMHTVGFTIGRPVPRVLDDLHLVKVLLANGANPDAPLSSPIRGRNHSGGDRALGGGTTPLIRAGKVGDLAMMQLLLDGGANPNAALWDGTTGVMIAAAFGAGGGGDEDDPRVRGSQAEAIDAIRLYAKYNARLDAQNDNGETALFYATLDGMLKFLVEQGLSPDAKNYEDKTPLDVWLSRRDREGALTRPATVAALRQIMGRTDPAQ